MKRAYKYRIYPNDEQKEYFDKCFEIMRFIWNFCLDRKKQVYEDTKEDISAHFVISKEITKLKKEDKYSFLNLPPARALGQVYIDLDTAYKRFFQKISKFPNYKKRG